MDYLRKTWAKVRAVLVSMPSSQRYSVAALLGIVAVSIVMLVTWGGRDELIAPALTGLSPAEMAAATKALDEARIPYRVETGMVLVRAADKDRVPMVLVEKNALPSDISKSFTFDDLVLPKGFSMETDQELQMKHNIALGNTLARIIATSPDISKAQVLIGIGRDGFFSKEEATAAVSVVPRVADSLPAERLAGICRMVAAAAGPKRSARAVVVTNMATGESFSLESDDSPYAKAASFIDLQKRYDEYYSKAVEKFLAPVLGQVRTIVTVKWDPSTKTTEQIEYSVTRKSTDSTVTTGAAAPAGDTLTQANVAASVATSSTAGQGGKSETSRKEESSEPSMKVAPDTPPGQISDIGLSVLADRERIEAVVRSRGGLKAEDAVDAVKVDEECRNWETTLMAALPRDATSKVTSVRFNAVPFAKAPFVTAAAAVSGPAGTRLLDAVTANWHRLALAVLAVVALFMIRGVARRTETEAEVQAAKPAAEEEIELPEPEIDQDQKRAGKMREAIEELARTDPGTAASLVRRWMARES